MTFEISWVSKLNIPHLPFARFLQKMANRICVGHIQYGPPNRAKRYLTRLKSEVRAYQKTGNVEYLYNIANYAFLESIAPEHEKHHENNFVPSVTRGKVK